ncbi:PKD domain-containing protein [Fulvivirga ligni]|uniref:PKD domain-containing protein n=1 Tax=Fulvivirga ligni TaxID=2904246 RepID=UPI001F25E7B8|nr:PKD domain-containing protein [Fulvivirga ligni]UII22645.1 PKD domain-containing protein [Fulvivirga ligni]
MKNKYLIILGALLALSASLFAQTNVIPPSPNSAAANNLSGINVGASGVGVVDVPLYTLKGKDISIPISLRYSTSGIKVQDVASSVGLGWALDAGGSITRVVNDAPDVSSDYNFIGEDEINKVNTGYNHLYDSELDVFIYSFLGRSGKFYLDPETNVGYTQPSSDLIIEYIPGGVVQGAEEADGIWKITDESGNIFTFSYVENTLFSQMNMELSYDDVPSDGAYQEKYSYTSSWNLYTIQNPNRIELAKFIYTNHDIEYNYYSEQEFTSCDGSGTPRHFYTNSKLNVSQGYIKSIETSLGKVDFYYQSGRRDLKGGYSLERVTLSNDNLIGNCVLNYSYHNSVQKEYFSLTARYHPIECRNDYDCNRFMLRSIIRDNILYRRFEYHSEVPLPSRDAVLYDHWGYSTWDPNPSYPRYSDRNARGWKSSIYPHSDKSPNEVGSTACALKRIIYPTGGYQNLEYEGHDNVGGIRIKKIFLSDGHKEWLDKEFTYSGFHVINQPIHNYQYYTGGNCNEVRSSSPINDIIDLNGVSIIYNKIVEISADGSSIERNYNYTPDTPPSVNAYVFESKGDKFYDRGPIDYNRVPYAKKNSRRYASGNLTDIIYRNSNNKMIKSVHYNYEFGSENFSKRNHQVLYSIPSDNSGFVYTVNFYNVVCQSIKISDISVVEYDENQSETMRTNTSLEYGITNHPSLITKLLTTFSDGTRFKQTFNYMTDFEMYNPSPFLDLKVNGLFKKLNTHNIASPFETISYIAEPNQEFKVTSGKLLVYKFYNDQDRYYPYESYNLRLDAPIPESQFINLSFGQTSNELNWDDHYHKESEASYVNQNIKEVKNLYDGMSFQYEWHSNGLLKSVTKVRANNYQNFKTSYNSTPLIGLKQLTDINQKSFYLDYDERNRLSLEKDNAGNILVKYQYDQTEICDFEISANYLGNNKVAFNAMGNCYSGGTSSYYWDFGDGNVVKTNTLNVSHTYTGSPYDKYNVKLVVENDNFPTVYFSKQISTLGNQ